MLTPGLLYIDHDGMKHEKYENMATCQAFLQINHQEFDGAYIFHHQDPELNPDSWLPRAMASWGVDPRGFGILSRSQLQPVGPSRHQLQVGKNSIYRGEITPITHLSSASYTGKKAHL